MVRCGEVSCVLQAAPSDCSQDSGSITTNRATLVDHRSSFKSNLSDTDVMFLNVSPSRFMCASPLSFSLRCFVIDNKSTVTFSYTLKKCYPCETHYNKIMQTKMSP